MTRYILVLPPIIQSPKARTRAGALPIHPVVPIPTQTHRMVVAANTVIRTNLSIHATILQTQEELTEYEEIYCMQCQNRCRCRRLPVPGVAECNTHLCRRRRRAAESAMLRCLSRCSKRAHSATKKCVLQCHFRRVGYRRRILLRYGSMIPKKVELLISFTEFRYTPHKVRMT